MGVCGRLALIEINWGWGGCGRVFFANFASECNFSAMTPTGTLYLFPVPLSESPVADVLPARNIALLKSVRHFIVENVRSARRFLRSCDSTFPIDESSFVELNRHTRAEEIDSFIAPLLEGHDVGVISEAGCPAIADPGADVVAIAQRRGIRVVPLGGPSSILMSLMASGFNGQSFAFQGHLPIDAGERQRKLKWMETAIARDSQSQIFIETPFRNNKLIEELARLLPPSLRLCVASGITSEQESIVTRTIGQWRQAKYDYNKIPTIFLLYK